MYTLPFDCARCHGYMQGEDKKLKQCQSRDTCMRYLSRERYGPRTPFMLVESETNEKCEYYWEKAGGASTEDTKKTHERMDDA